MEITNTYMANKIYQKLLELQKAVVGLTKDKNGNSYQYVSGDKILGIVRPKMDELGLILIPEVIESDFSRQEYGTKNGPKAEMFCALRMRFTWVDADTGESLECMWASSGMNNWDKGLGSALTYGERYFLLKFFHIATDKDDVDAPKTAEEEMSVQTAISYINAAQDAEALKQYHAYYSQYPKVAKDKAYLQAFNLKMKTFNDAAQSQR